MTQICEFRFTGAAPLFDGIIWIAQAFPRDNPS
jgi:hypothetical protein